MPTFLEIARQLFNLDEEGNLRPPAGDDGGRPPWQEYFLLKYLFLGEYGDELNPNPKFYGTIDGAIKYLQENKKPIQAADEARSIRNLISRPDPSLNKRIANANLPTPIWIAIDGEQLSVIDDPEEVATRMAAFLSKIPTKTSRRDQDLGNQTFSNIFNVRPVQGFGENIFFIYDKGKPFSHKPLDHFFVNLHFHLWTKYAFEIISIELRYTPVAMPGPQKVKLNGEKYKVDYSCCIFPRATVDQGSVVDVLVSRQFHCKAARCADNGQTKVILEIAGPQWSGIHHLIIDGRLDAGDLNVHKVHFEGGM